MQPILKALHFFRFYTTVLLLSICNVLLAQPFKVVDNEHSNINYRSNKNTTDVPFEGHGIGIADFNKDGLQDLFFAGDSLFGLYQNVGSLRFQNVFSKSNIKPEKGAHTVSLVDFNYDGYTDIVLGFVIRLHKNDTLHIKIYLNEGNFTFREANKTVYKINSTLPSISRINIFDVNKDGFYDVLINHWNGENNQFLGILPNIKAKANDTLLYDKLYIYENGKYIDKTKQYHLFSKVPFRVCFNSIATDLNADGYPDLIFSNDFDEPDQIYLNKEGKYFEDTKNHLFKATSFYGMGSDAADINNDGLIDYFECDMRPVGNYGCKTIRYETPYTWYELSKDKNNFLENQFVRNTLQLNNGAGLPFSEIGQLAGVDASEWSWSPLLADLDNDGLKDLFISNGVWHPKAFEYDFVHHIMAQQKIDNKITAIEYLKADTLVADYFKNYVFKNNGDLTFQNKQMQWGFEKPIDSRGSAYADLDNDGDLDIIVNNSNAHSFIYENLNTENKNHFLRIQLLHPKNKPTWHSTATIYYNKGKQQFVEQNPIRGFYSTSENILHFGLADVNAIDSLLIKWHDGKTQLLKNIAANQLLTINYENAIFQKVEKPSIPSLFKKSNLISWKDKADNSKPFINNPLITETIEDSTIQLSFQNNQFTIEKKYNPLYQTNNINPNYYQPPHLPFHNKPNYNQNMQGFWNCITPADIDNDGDMDYLLGNLGLNTRWKATQTHPLKIYFGDLDNNGSQDIVATHFENDKEYPNKPLDVYKSRISGLAKKFYTYDLFGKATIQDMFSATQLANATVFEAYETRSGLLLNEGNNQFVFKPFNNEAQLSPIFSIVAEDFNRDGYIDILATGNQHGIEVERGKYTASNGLYLEGNGKGNFMVSNDKSFQLIGQGRQLQLFPYNQNTLLITAVQLNDSLLSYTYNIANNDEIVFFPENKTKALLKLNNGASRFYETTISLKNKNFILKRKDEAIVFP